jgi:hypothetical protein
MEKLGLQFRAEEWWTFTDSSKVSLKAVLLYNENKEASIPTAHANGMKETYDNIPLILNEITYREHHRQLCGDLELNII